MEHPGREGAVITVNPGSTLVLNCVYDGLPPPNAQWYCGNSEIPGQTSSRLEISNFQ